MHLWRHYPDLQVSYFSLNTGALNETPYRWGVIIFPNIILSDNLYVKQNCSFQLQQLNVTLKVVNLKRKSKLILLKYMCLHYDSRMWVLQYRINQRDALSRSVDSNWFPKLACKLKPTTWVWENFGWVNVAGLFQHAFLDARVDDSKIKYNLK